jgi:hypothetical protein
VSFAAINLCFTSQCLLIFVVYFVIDSVRTLLDTPSYHHMSPQWNFYGGFVKDEVHAPAADDDGAHATHSRGACKISLVCLKNVAGGGMSI